MPARRQRGFTLVELIVVLGIIAMVALLAAPRLGDLGPGVELRQAAEALRADLRRARNAALTRHRDIVILIDTAAAAWADAGGRRLGQLPRGASLTAELARQEQLAAHTAGIRFYPDGSATGGTLTLSRGPQRLVVTVDWFDGGVSVARADG